MAILAAGTFLTAMPMAVKFHPDSGFSLGAAKAFAKDGGDDDGGDDDDHGGSSSGSSGGGSSSSDDSGDDDHGGSSSGSSGGGSSSSDDSGDDDHGGSSSGSGNSNSGSGRSGGDDDGNDDHGGGGADDSAGDDHGGRGRGGDDGPGDDHGGGRPAGNGAAPGGGLQVVKIERTATGVEVVYSNGVKEEIEDGRYELKNPAGRTVMERSATQRDVTRINANAKASHITPGTSVNGPVTVPGGSQARRVEVSGSAIEVIYDTGWKEEIEAGRYELKDPNNNTVVQRRATSADRSRLRALAGS
jgi:hypothetical protein